ncbi:DUF2637 domain-containing protein [Kitasatospora sp. A2-31]|uniref:DUF2637 domain-containing protein n=1 Tax=Kitasatospora sp. A2-31 TaxID=2916414 RepID=UPI001EEEF150|nr:DUF2637 domain-containing protein [Kitasatospora sp. A2-31]MCG6499367.1 DUF2637 domain-containing protein [Kitasatospora sp. A2-31]
MPTTQPATHPTGSGTLARTTVTVVMTVIAGLAFTFSFGNVWGLALRLGVPHPVAPLIAPMVDLSVLGLLIALHHLSTSGVDPAQLRSAAHLMHLCGVLTLVLNTAEPILAGHYGRAALDAVAPLLLLGWGVVGPALLRQLHAPSSSTTGVDTARLAQSEPGNPSAGNEGDTEPNRVRAAVSATEAEVAQPPTSPSRTPSVSKQPAAPRKRTGRRPAASMDELREVVGPAVAEKGATHAVIKEAVRCAGLSISNDRAGKLLELVKNEQAGQPEAVRTHTAVG